jgi:serine-type D-Ala-D-Ala carboxypeptidase (penicillin-binding protein 5/6)
MRSFLKKEEWGEYSLLVAAILIPVLALGYFFFSENIEKSPKKEVPQQVVETNQAFEDLEILAKTALVTELNTGKILYSKRGGEKQPIASITKLFTSLVASEKLRRIGVESVLIREGHLTPHGDWGLATGDTWGIGDLIDFTLLTSSNDGAKALAVSAFPSTTLGTSERVGNSKFISEMNSFSRRLGLQDTYFLNETGLDVRLESEAGAYSSASDIAKILEYITFTKPELFDGTRNPTRNFYVGGKYYDSDNTNKVVNQLPGLLISKTGFTNIAGGNLVVVIDTGLNNPVSIVVLGSTKDGRFEDILKLYDETIDFYIQN